MAIIDQPTETAGRLAPWRDTREWIARAQEQGELRLNQAVLARERPHRLVKRSGQADGTPKAAKWTTHS